MMLRGCENDEERNEIKSIIYRPVSDITAAASNTDEDMPEWASDFVPSWWGGHAQAEFDAKSSGVVQFDGVKPTV